MILHSEWYDTHCLAKKRSGRLEDISCGCGKDVTLFQVGQIIARDQAKKTSLKDFETTKIGLRTHSS